MSVQTKNLRVAFYSGNRKGLAGIYSRGVRWLEAGQFSHCELVFSDGMSASSSFIDGGVRYKRIGYSSVNDWTFVDVSWADEFEARRYFDVREGRGYDLAGNLHFLLGVVKHSEDKEFCSEAVAGALGIKNAWLIAPNNLYNILTWINQQIERNKMKANTMHGYIPSATDGDGGDDGTDTGDGNPPVKPPVKP